MGVLECLRYSTLTPGDRAFVLDYQLGKLGPLDRQYFRDSTRNCSSVMHNDLIVQYRICVIRHAQRRHRTVLYLCYTNLSYKKQSLSSSASEFVKLILLHSS